MNVREQGRFGSLSAYPIFAIIIIAPFPFGSVSPVAVALLCGLAGGSTVLLAFSSRSLPSPLVIATPVLILIVAYVTILYLQVVPRLPGDPSSHPIWAQAGALIGDQLVGQAAIARGQPYVAVGAPLLTLLMFVAGYLCGADDRLGRRLLRVTAWAGGCYAAFAIGYFAIEPTMVLWQEKIAYTTSLTGTFTNRNAAAVFFGSCANIWLILFLQKVGATEGPRRRRSRRRRVDGTSRARVTIGPWAIPLAFFAACLAATLLSGSRAGAGCTFIGLVVAFFVMLRRSFSYPHARRLLKFGAAIFGLIMIYLVFDSGIGERFEFEGIEGGGRLDVLASVLRMIADFPWLGTGLGTFRWSFPAYRSGDISGWGVWDKAHNVLAEIASEGGISLAAVIFGAWVAALSVLAAAIFRDRAQNSLVRVALPVSVVAITHSFIDFSMQIPAYSVMVAALLGGGVAQSLRSAAAANERINPEQERPEPSTHQR